jgi:hypothetical protein
MATRSFDFFCVPEEAFDVLADALRDAPIALLYTEGPKGGLPLRRTSLDNAIANNHTVLWASAGDDEPTSFLGLVRIWLPRYRENLLCMASIGVKVGSDGEKFTANLKLYERLKKAFKQRLRAGIWGVNRKYGGEQFYKNYYISDGAIMQFRAGRELAPEGGDGFVRFEYRTGET